MFHLNEMILPTASLISLPTQAGHHLYKTAVFFLVPGREGECVVSMEIERMMIGLFSSVMLAKDLGSRRCKQPGFT